MTLWDKWPCFLFALTMTNGFMACCLFFRNLEGRIMRIIFWVFSYLQAGFLILLHQSLWDQERGQDSCHFGVDDVMKQDKCLLDRLLLVSTLWEGEGRQATNPMYSIHLMLSPHFRNKGWVVLGGWEHWGLGGHRGHPAVTLECQLGIFRQKGVWF